MNTKFIFCFISLLISLPINAQEGWFWQNPYRKVTPLVSVKFISSSIGWAVGDLGTILEQRMEDRTGLFRQAEHFTIWSGFPLQMQIMGRLVGLGYDSLGKSFG